MQKPIITSWWKLDGRFEVNVIIGNYAYTYTLQDSYQLGKILKSKYFGFRALKWIKENALTVVKREIEEKEEENHV